MSNYQVVTCSPDIYNSIFNLSLTVRSHRHSRRKIFVPQIKLYHLVPNSNFTDVKVAKSQIIQEKVWLVYTTKFSL